MTDKSAIERFLCRLQLIERQIHRLEDRISVVEEQTLSHENRLQDIETKEDDRD